MIQRRSFLTGAAATTAALTLPLTRVMAGAGEEIKPFNSPQPISPPDTLALIA